MRWNLSYVILSGCIDNSPLDELFNFKKLKLLSRNHVFDVIVDSIMSDFM